MRLGLVETMIDSVLTRAVANSHLCATTKRLRKDQLPIERGRFPGIPAVGLKTPGDPPRPWVFSIGA